MEASSPVSNPPGKHASDDSQHKVREGLNIIFATPGVSIKVSDKPPLDVDIVVVDGVYCSWDNYTGASFGSGNSGWVKDYIRSLYSDSRILRFKYNANQVFDGNQSRRSIRRLALRLLVDLTNLRKNEPKKRVILFVGHDIGGVIVKDALVAATHNLASWGEIFDCCRLQVFCGCPQRSIDSRTMANELSRFLYFPYHGITNGVDPRVDSIPGLADAIIEINGLFIDSKVCLRSYVISIHAQRTPQWQIHYVFNSYSGVLGVPFEKRIADEPGPESHRRVINCLQNMKAYFALDAESLRRERSLLSLAPAVPRFTTSHFKFKWTKKMDLYQEWIEQPKSQVLYVHNAKGVLEASEQIFYSLGDLQTQKRNLVLYFSFDRWDVRCNSIKDMLSTFLAQIICHQAENLSEWVEIVFERLNKDRGWTEFDAIHWFDYIQYTYQDHPITCVINYFDDCASASRKAFLELFSQYTKESELSWKIAITSRKPGALLDELSELPFINLDTVTLEREIDKPRYFETDITRLVGLRPELHGFEDLLQKELDGLTDLDPLARYVIWKQATLCKEWPEKTSIQKFFRPLNHHSENGDNNYPIELILDRVLRTIPDQDSVRRLFAWLLYCVRPLTTWELATVMFIGTDIDQGVEACPSPSALKDFISKTETWLAAFIEVKHNEIRIWDPRLREIFMEPGAEGGPRYFWNEIRETAHFDIAKLCLDYLSRESVQWLIEETYQDPEFDYIEASNFPDRTNLCSYAVQAWTHHFALSSPNLKSSILLDVFTQPAIMRCWSKGYWALSNPITRSSHYFESLFPVFVGLDLPDLVKPRDDKDLSLGLLQASSNGRASIVADLLERTEHSKSTLLDALIAAGSAGKEQIMLDLIDHISAATKNDAVDWPPILLYRAAWLGLERLAERLLKLGLPPDSDDKLRVKFRMTPLYIASRQGHISTVRVLLDNGADVELASLTSESKTPLISASSKGQGEVAKVLVEEGKAKVGREG